MDKEWLNFPRLSIEYREGVKKFVEAASKRAVTPGMIQCPCTKCVNHAYASTMTVEEHLGMYGMDPGYIHWYLHGESFIGSTPIETVSETRRMYRDANIETHLNVEPDVTLEDEDFVEILKDVETPLYEGCLKHTKLSAAVALHKHKSMYGHSDKSFDELLNIIRDMLPPDNVLPESFYSTKKLLKAFDLGYEKIHACPNDCCLFRKELYKHDECPKCHVSRWKTPKDGEHVQKKIPRKVLRYFPIIRRFRRMYTSIEMANDLKWHSTHKSQDGKMRHPVDSEAWNTIDQKWPSFALEPRNLRLGLSTDGFNPFSIQSMSYSCWPVVLVMYNLPPWKCMAKENLMLTLLIPGEKQPGNNIDVYLQPLIEDLKELWEKGVQVYDASTGSTFNLKAILMWTINDFPAYGNLAGCCVKGEYACPACGLDVSSQRLKFCSKHVYMGHRRFLPMSHPFRKNRAWFNGKEEMDDPPIILNGKQVRSECSQVQNDWGKTVKGKRKRTCHPIWKKQSIFFDLPYWEELSLRHNFDVMHIEKNICESLVGTLLDISGKTKDGVNSRRDLQDIGIRHDLHVKEDGDKLYLPAAPHTLSKVEKQVLCKRLLNLKLPDGYASNISRCISLDDCKIVGLKSHDCHVLMQHLLSVAIRGLLPKGPRVAIFRLCTFFNELCQRVLDRAKLDALEDEVVITMCMLERYFPPSFFDIMVHLTIHLTREARLCGPVHYRWMYPFERFMKVLKGYVRNRARPEGCIAKCYIADECMQFCSKYVRQAEDIGEKHSRNEDIPFENIVEGRPLSAGTTYAMRSDLLKVAHTYILFNSAVVQPYLTMHLEDLQQRNPSLASNPTLLQKEHTKNFSSWFHRKVIIESSSLDKTLRWLAVGPNSHVTSYTSYVVNGTRYRTKDSEKTTQDSGVSLEAETICTERDGSQVVKKMVYYGVLTEILVLNFYEFRVPLFKCNWVGNGGNDVRVEDGFTLVNLRRPVNRFDRDPFILASQATQVFYSREHDTSNWYVVLKAPQRGFHDVEKFDEHAYGAPIPVDVSQLDSSMDENDEYARNDCDDLVIDM